VALLHHGQVVGELLVAARDAGHPLDRRDEQAVRRMADYVAVVVHARRLTDELELSRERAAVAREEERRRLRRDLHDGLGPELAAIALQLETLRDLADGPDTPAGALADILRAHVRTALGEVRRIVDGLRPPMLDDLGLVAALQEQVERFTGPSFRVTLDIDDDLPPLPAAVETAVLRIVAEAVTNACRHGAAHTCTVTLAASAGQLLLDVIDDGRGIGPDAAETIGVGLGSMDERAVELGGRCHVEPAVRGGTAVRARIPFVRPDVPVR
jgi:signal transduction histidine kinase